MSQYLEIKEKDFFRDQKGSLVPQITETFKTKSGKRIVRGFLLDDSVNLKGEHVNREALHRDINTFLGKPLLIAPVHHHATGKMVNHHPQWDGVNQNWHERPEFDIIGDMLKHQHRLSVGTMYDIRLDKYNPDKYWFEGEVTNPIAIEEFDKGNVPRFVSAGLIAGPEDGNEITRFYGLHVAFVDSPAYGFDKAIISHDCKGDDNSCIARLRMNAEDLTECPVCIAGRLRNMQNKLTDAHSSYNISEIKNDSESMSSDTNSTDANSNPAPEAKTEAQKADVTPINTPKPSTNESQAPSQETKEPVKETEKSVAAVASESVPTSDLKSDAKSKDENNELINRIAEAIMVKVDERLKPFSEFKSKIEQREQQQVLDAKSALISKFITKEHFDGDEEAAGRERTFYNKLPLDNEQLEQLLAKQYKPLMVVEKRVQNRSRGFSLGDMIDNPVVATVSKKSNANSSQDLTGFTDDIMPLEGVI